MALIDSPSLYILGHAKLPRVLVHLIPTLTHPPTSDSPCLRFSLPGASPHIIALKCCHSPGVLLGTGTLTWNKVSADPGSPSPPKTSQLFNWHLSLTTPQPHQSSHPLLSPTRMSCSFAKPFLSWGDLEITDAESSVSTTDEGHLPEEMSGSVHRLWSSPLEQGSGAHFQS